MIHRGAKKLSRKAGVPAWALAALVLVLAGTAGAALYGSLVSVQLLATEAQKEVWPFDRERALKAQPGFEINLFATNLGRPRFMAVGPEGHIYVSISREDRIMVLPDRDHDGVADEKIVFAEGLARPHGLVFRDGELIVAQTGSLIALKDTDGDLRADEKRTITTDIPPGGGHWTRTLAVGPDGRYYVSVGSTCNACEEEDYRRASVLWFWPDGGSANTFATGLRNSVGLEFHPETGELWGVDNGRDWLGDNLPPEELNRITDGGDYGWPHCYGDRVPDPDHGSKERCQETIPPVVKMQAHSAPLGVAFGYDLNFPREFRNVLYVAFHGSWNRTVPTGYKVIGIPFEDGRPSGEPFDFLTGWLEPGGENWGRPVDPLVGPDGALYVSDDFAGAVYRVTRAKDVPVTGSAIMVFNSPADLR